MTAPDPDRMRPRVAVGAHGSSALHRGRPARGTAGDLRRPRSEIIIATDNESWFARFDRTFVAFEAGHVESGTRDGWSVVVLGHARTATGSEYLSGFDHSGPSPWTIQSSDCYLVLDIEHVTGRRMTLPRLTGDQR
ncbi:pyridoxamine 5'-phosphate oxidase family protein [Rhodococcus opacus]|uniref:pyridoxamine 5'-phosphate oxidase family protein n=1 Tax=Rhodococcus opacus TaxID=37919 RepID=UPI00211F1395|nr:pyridoxamine 5'-phosphate oxidase family protein [Rhodococcus opacus]